MGGLMSRQHVQAAAVIGAVMAFASARAVGQDQVVHAVLTYGAPGNGPAPNFSPKGTEVALTDLAAGAPLPLGSVRPAKIGTMQIGPDRKSWMSVLATADADHPADLCRLYLDRNRNGRFDDDGPALVTTPTENEKTKAWWSSFAKTEVPVPYAGAIVEPYLVSFWIVRETKDAPNVVRYSVASWRAGKAVVDGVDALVAVMDANNDAVFDKTDMWSVLAATEPDAAKRVLSLSEARPMNRLMFLEAGDKERVIEFRSMSPDGRSIDFALVDRPITKKADRAPDDELAPERGRPRATTPFEWRHGRDEYVTALAHAQATGRRVLLDFETTWCGPCRQMDEWIWSDREVAGVLNAGYIGVKLDGDIEKDLVKTFKITGYPSGVMLDSAGREAHRFLGYQTSAEILALLQGSGHAGRTRAQWTVSHRTDRPRPSE
jgi:thiol-disulfide isomerase/thioredoxin